MNKDHGAGSSVGGHTEEGAVPTGRALDERASALTVIHARIA